MKKAMFIVCLTLLSASVFSQGHDIFHFVRIGDYLTIKVDSTWFGASMSRIEVDKITVLTETTIRVSDISSVDKKSPFSDLSIQVHINMNSNTNTMYYGLYNSSSDNRVLAWNNSFYNRLLEAIAEQ